MNIILLLFIIKELKNKNILVIHYKFYDFECHQIDREIVENLYICN